MAHGYLWLFNMRMCCRMQISSLCAKLKMYKETGNTTSLTVNPDCPAAPNEDYLFDCMNLYAKIDAAGVVELSGTVFYWNPVVGDTQKSATIQTFPDINSCIEWFNNDSAQDMCIDVLDENC